MSLLYKVYTYLQQIKNKEISFQLLLNKGFKEENENDVALLKSSLKSIINKYHYLNWELNNILPVRSQEIKDYLICALGQYHYVKELDDKAIFSFFNEDKDFLVGFSVGEVIKAFKSLNNQPLTLSEKDQNNMIKRLSVNYAYPEWIVKMMIKHFGLKRVYKSIAASRKTSEITVNINTLLTSKEKVMNKNEGEFVEGSLSKNSLKHVGKDKIINLPDFKTNRVFVQDEVSQLLVDKLNLELGDNALLVAEDKGSISVHMLHETNDTGTLHVLHKDLNNVIATRNMVKRFNLKNIEVVEAPINLAITYIGKNTLDKALIIPESTNLGLVRKNPQILLTLKQDDIDSLILNEKQHLNEVAELMKIGGRLVYAVYTYNKKESSLLIQDFLNEHKDYKLIEEEQIFAYSASTDGAYYAILERIENDD